ncbi:hypothetical protein RRSWK_04436 [Rhodopirellula sp. SWK7]|nr:hypothetical protein RRSWK_04436 [Rhodopirellula sp. SWK7]
MDATQLKTRRSDAAEGLTLPIESTRTAIFISANFVASFQLKTFLPAAHEGTCRY